jgi:GNAT superfamily N-acetyltransferase
MNFQIHQLTKDSQQEAWKRLRAIRLRALQEAPDAFGSTFADARTLPEHAWQKQLSLVTFLATADTADVGMARYCEHVGPEDPHSCDPPDTDKVHQPSASLISLWVAPEARGKGVGDALVSHIIARARQEGFAQL